MSVKVRKRTDKKKVVRFKRKRKIRSTVEGSSERPRLCIFRSNTNVYAQLIDDQKGHTLASASTKDAELKDQKSTVEGAKQVGALLAKRAQAKKIESVVFDRNGYLYHGRVKALADAAREAGLKF
ncbi:MAG: 50S ribosomal protein L18 [Bdellovibrionaceae bacterium]|nr:50S ribosomal protein L18 [Pseudobdellovibrionaceae bacterium]|tara:strand:- start:186 stop:560 length:375 start_codon:yes stop_codon:yes gene_type:complete